MNEIIASVREDESHGYLELPRLFRFSADSIICGGCRRSWRKPEFLSFANFEYLCQHATDHKPMIKRRPKGVRPYKRWTRSR